MNLRSRFEIFPPEEGTRCWVSNAHTRIRLPVGLEDRTPVIFRGRNPEDCTRARLERADGVIFEVAHNQYETPLLWEVGNEWLLEDDPRTHQKMKDYIEWLRLDPCDPAIVIDREATISHLEWIIQRSGGTL